jgi:nucleotide-binding universal stress UspA family protein
MAEATGSRRQGIDEIMRRAEAMGLDPRRVATALDPGRPPQAEQQVIEEVQPASRVLGSFARNFARRD